MNNRVAHIAATRPGAARPNMAAEEWRSKPRVWRCSQMQSAAARADGLSRGSRPRGSARLAAAEEARREAEREEARREAARVAAAEEARREAARGCGGRSPARSGAMWPRREEARREAERLAAEEAAREAASGCGGRNGPRGSGARDEACRRVLRGRARLRGSTRINCRRWPRPSGFAGQEVASASEESVIAADSMHEASASSAGATCSAPAGRGSEPFAQSDPIRNAGAGGRRSDALRPGRLLRVSSARGASTFISRQGRVHPCASTANSRCSTESRCTLPATSSRFCSPLMPARSHEALRTGAATEWISQLEGVGRVRCMSFRDQRGPGGVFRLMPIAIRFGRRGRSAEADAGAGGRAAKACVLIAGTRARAASGRTMAAFVDLMQQDAPRSHHHRSNAKSTSVHERATSFISQREVRGNDDDMLSAMRAALREDPDVLVVEELRTAALMNVALGGRGSRPARHRRLHRAHRARRHRSHHRPVCARRASTGPDGAALDANCAASSRRCCCESRRRPSSGSRGAAEHAGGVERDCGGEDVAAADGDRRRTRPRHDAAQRRARGPGAQRFGRSGRCLPALAGSPRLPGRAQPAGISTSFVEHLANG